MWNFCQMWKFRSKESIYLFSTSNQTWRLLKYLDSTIVQQSVEKNEISSENLYTQKFSCQTCQGSFSWSWCQEKNSLFQALFWHLQCTFIFDFCCNKIQYVRDYMAIQVFDNAQLYVSTLAWPQCKPCSHCRDPCNESRVFPLRKTSQGKPCFHHRDWFAVLTFGAHYYSH